MSIEDLKKKKAEVLAMLPDMAAPLLPLVENTDGRLATYIRGVMDTSTDVHNLYECLSVQKFLRLLGTYEWREEPVRKFIQMYENLKFNGIDGRRTYKLTPIQVFQFASIFGFYRADGTRLTRQAILFLPRKFGKTTSVASLSVNEILNGDANGQAYMAANSDSQSSICYKEAKALITQLDPKGKLFRVTQSEINWLPNNPFGREGSITKLTAGGRTKDGLNASLVIYDEYAAARYVKDHSDGAELLNVLTSSMGTRRNPLTVIITTANRVSDGPFEVMLNDAKDALLSGESDWQFACILEPDVWEREDKFYGDPRIWSKCNPHIGITIQPHFYANEWEQAKRNPEKYKEFLCKYLNVFQSDTVKDWIASAKVRGLQGNRRIDAIDPAREKWKCFIGMDFSRGDDLCGMAYLCYNPNEKRFFVDCDCWITEETLTTNTNSTLYSQWVQQGWLHVCPGKVIEESVITDRVEELYKHVTIMQFGYDPYDAKVFINHLEAWVASKGGRPSEYIRSVKQTWGQFNSACQMFQRLVNMEVVEFSPNPILPWCFGNAVLEEDKFQNVKPVKRSANAKIDMAICTLEGVIMLEEATN